jgi:DNA mismatch repair ATPase MutS
MAFHESQKTGTEKDANYDITFLYQMVEGGAGRSYGLNVAKMAGKTTTQSIEWQLSAGSDG